MPSRAKFPTTSNDLQRVSELVRKPDLQTFQRRFDELIELVQGSELQRLKQTIASAFEALLDVQEIPAPEVVAWFANHMKRGNVALTPALDRLVRRLNRKIAQENERQRHGRFDSATTIIQSKRVVQMSWFGMAGWDASDAFEVRRSVFKSAQERTFMRALRERFPGLVALPNYPLDQITDFDKLRKLVADDAWQYGKHCKIDAVLITPIEGDAVAAFELDSKFHDNPEVSRRDRWKNALLEATGIPLFRLRSDDPQATTVDEWFQLLTDEVLDKISVGERLRVRDVHPTLVPLVR